MVCEKQKFQPVSNIVRHTYLTVIEKDFKKNPYYVAILAQSNYLYKLFYKPVNSD
jgi:hypothetical protein